MVADVVHVMRHAHPPLFRVCDAPPGVLRYPSTHLRVPYGARWSHVCGAEVHLRKVTRAPSLLQTLAGLRAARLAGGVSQYCAPVGICRRASGRSNPKALPASPRAQSHRRDAHLAAVPTTVDGADNLSMSQGSRRHRLFHIRAKCAGGVAHLTESRCPVMCRFSRARM